MCHHVLSVVYIDPGKAVFVFFATAQSRMCANNWLGALWPKCVHVLHYHNADLSEGFELITWLLDMFCRVCDAGLVNSIGYLSWNIWGWVFTVYPISLLMVVRIYAVQHIVTTKWALTIISYYERLGQEALVSDFSYHILQWMLSVRIKILPTEAEDFNDFFKNDFVFKVCRERPHSLSVLIYTFVTHPDEIPISAKSSGWHMVVWYIIRMTYCSVQKSSGWDTAMS